MNYIISLKHTMRHSPFLTLWRPNNSGYCYALESAGKYDQPEKGYHDSESNTPIDIEKANKLSIECGWDNREIVAIPNVKIVWDQLGVKMTKNGLKKK